MLDRAADVGEVLFERGAPADAVYFIVEGELEMQAADEEDPLVFGPNSIVGILDCNAGRPRLRSAVVSKPAKLLVMPYRVWLDALEDFPEFTSTSRRLVARGVHDMMLGLDASLEHDGGLGLLDRPRPLDASVAARVARGDRVATMFALGQSRPFEACTVDTLADLAERVAVLTPPAGELLFGPQLGGNHLFIVVAGRVHIERRFAPIIRFEHQPGDTLLGGAALSGVLSEYSAIAGPRSVVLAVSFADIDDVSDDHFDLSRSLLRSTSLDRERLMTKVAARRSRTTVTP
ncbi:MAG: cyclic nucleotide-binding domain-containing protein [Polyangiaceae bacterium]